MGEEVLIIACIVYLGVLAIGAGLMDKAAKRKGYENDSIFAKCFFLGIFGYLYVLALPDLKLQNYEEQILSEIKQIKSSNSEPISAINTGISHAESSSEEWKCGKCGNMNKPETKFCSCCGTHKYAIVNSK